MHLTHKLISLNNKRQPTLLPQQTSDVTCPRSPIHGCFVIYLWRCAPQAASFIYATSGKDATKVIAGCRVTCTNVGRLPALNNSIAMQDVVRQVPRLVIMRPAAPCHQCHHCNQCHHYAQQLAVDELSLHGEAASTTYGLRRRLQ